MLEDDESSASYDPSIGSLTVTLTKANKGQFFDDLDLLAKLLAPRRSMQDPSPSIEVLSAENRLEDDLVTKTEALSLERGEFAEGKPLKTRTWIYTNFFFRCTAEENDWQFPQKVPGELNTSVQSHYGFLDMHSGYLRHVTHTENEVNELGDAAESCTKAERRVKRLKHEDEKFDEEHYM